MSRRPAAPFRLEPALRALPAIVLVLATLGLAFLGVRALVAERAIAERTARDRLRGIAREAAGRIAAAAARLTSQAATGSGAAVLGENGEFLAPLEPQPLRPLRVTPGSDPEGEFYLAQADRADWIDHDAARAEGLLRAAAGENREPVVRALARFRLAAVMRRSNRLEEVEAARAAFLDGLPSGERSTTEALLARALSPAPDPSLSADLLRCLGAGDDAIVLGLLSEFGLTDDAAIASRRADLERMERIRPLMPSLSERAPVVRLRGDLLVAFTPLPDGGFNVVEGTAPTLPPGVAVLESGPQGPRSDLVLEEVFVGDPLAGVRVVASLPRRDVEADADRRSLLLGAALGILLLGGVAALVLTWRAARRESEAARAREALLAQVGHDLRTPLARARLYADTLASGRVSDPVEAREFIRIIVRETEELSRIVGNVLDLSRASSGRTSLERRPVDLARVVAEVADAHRPLLAEAGLALSVTSEPRTIDVEADESALRGAIGNLIENALRHAASGGAVDVEASTRNGSAEVRVMDRGPGLPLGLDQRIFERFVRGPGATSRGAGLGLALVREVARAHGGDARADNREGGGAIFTLEIPAARSAP